MLAGNTAGYVNVLQIKFYGVALGYLLRYRHQTSAQPNNRIKLYICLRPTDDLRDRYLYNFMFIYIYSFQI